MPIFHCKHVLFSRKLRFAVSADRLRLILCCVRRAFLPIEYVIGAEVDELRAFLTAKIREVARRFGINQKRAIALGLASIDIRERCRVNQHIQSQRAQLLAQTLLIRKIKLRVIEASDIVFRSEFAHERSPEPPARADN